MNNMERFELVIEYIEEHLREQIDVSVLAKILSVSVYEFRRVFSFIAGVPLSDYIRKRRLSVAASSARLSRTMLSMGEAIGEIISKRVKKI